MFTLKVSSFTTTCGSIMDEKENLGRRYGGVSEGICYLHLPSKFDPSPVTKTVLFQIVIEFIRKM